MKKLITIVLMLALAVPVFAQDYDFEPEEKWTVKANAGYFPTVPTIILPFVAIAMGLATANKDNNEKAEVSLPPYASIEGLYSINSKWSVGLSAGYFGSVYRIIDLDDNHEVSRTDLLFIPIAIEGRFNYLIHQLDGRLLEHIIKQHAGQYAQNDIDSKRYQTRTQTAATTAGLL